MSTTYYGTLDPSNVDLFPQPGQAFPTDLEGTLVEIDCLPSGASVDEMFYFDSPNAGKYLSRILEGSIRAANIGVAPSNSGTVNRTRLNAAFSHSGLNEIIIDFNATSEIPISGTVDCQAKVLKFRKGNVLINETSGSLENVFLDGGIENYHIDPALILNNVTAVRETLSPEWFGATGDGNGNDTLAVQKYLDVAVNLNGGIVKFPARKSYRIESDLIIPDFHLGNICQCIIQGNGSTLKAVGNITLLKKTVVDQADAEIQINSRVLLSNMNFLGDGVSDQVGLLIQATYGTVIANCSFQNLKNGIDLQFCLNAKTFQNYFIGIEEFGLQARPGTWGDATGNNSQCNQTTFEQDRHFVSAAQLCCVSVLDSSNCHVLDCIFEGPANPVNNIIYSAMGATTSRSFYVTRPHIENTPTDCSILLSPVGGLVEISGIWAQQVHIFVAVTDDIVGNGDIVISNIIYLPGDSSLFRQPNATYNVPCWSFFNWPSFASHLPSYYFVADANNRLPYYIQYQSPAGSFQNVYTNYFESVGLRVQNNGNILMTALNAGNPLEDEILTLNGIAVGKVSVPGGIGIDTIKHVDDSYIIELADKTVLVNPSSVDLTISWNPAMDSKIRNIKNIGSSGKNVIISPTSGTIEGLLTNIVADGEIRIVQSDFTNLYLL